MNDDLTRVVAPSCHHRPACDGCPLLEQSGEEMHQHKRARLTREIEIAPETGTISIEPILEAPTREGWRHRARMVFGDARRPGESLLGFYEAGSRDVLEITSCAAHHPDIERVLSSFREHVGACEALTPHLRFIDARWGDSKDKDSASSTVILTLCMDHRVEHLDAWKQEVATLSEKIREGVEGVTLGLHLDVGTHGPAILSGDFVETDGPTATSQRVGEVIVEVPPKAFFQVNPPQLERTHGLMREWLGELKEGALLDLYCGVGAHALALATTPGQAARRVIGVDMSEDAITAAKQALEAHGLEGTFEVVRDDAADFGAQLDAMIGEEKLAAIVVNPARAGLHHGILPWLARHRDEIGALLYLSCEPKTLARDLIRLRRLGFEVERMQPIDMMPNTDQVETLAKLVRAEPWQTAPHVEHAYAASDAASSELERRLSPRVSGVKFTPGGESTWWAVVSGQAPVHGELPSIEGSAAKLVARRLSETRAYSVMEISAQGLMEDGEIRQRLRAWGYPVMGDTDYGDRRVNRRAYRIMGLDRAALHCLEDSVQGHAAVASELELCFRA